MAETKTITFPKDSVTYEAPRWVELTDLIFQLAKKISEDKCEFDRIISLAKGGWPIARTLADFLTIREASSIGTRSYTGINEQSEEVEIYQDLVDVEGQVILLLDDVADSGKTLDFVKTHLLKKGAKKVITATVYYKPRSIHKPDYFSAQTTSWILFPYEIIEMTKLLHDKWTKQGISKEEIRQRLLSIRCQPEWLQFLELE